MVGTGADPVASRVSAAYGLGECARDFSGAFRFKVAGDGVDGEVKADRILLDPARRTIPNRRIGTE